MGTIRGGGGSLEEFLAEPFVEVAEVDRAVARRYGALVAELRRNGTPIPFNDIWIAAITLTVDGRLLTFDRDPQRVTGLPLVLLSPPVPAAVAGS